MEILIYVGKVSLYWTLFYACYMLLLRQHTFFVWNRIYLLGSLLFSFVLPFVIFPETTPVPSVIYQVTAPAFTFAYSQQIQPRQSPLFTWTHFLCLIYFANVLFFSFKLYRNIHLLKDFVKNGELVDLGNYKVILIESNEVGSFSFLKWIIINRSDYENHFDAILRHEMVHVSQRHTFDILLIEILKIVFWFNPILILYKNSIQEIHEYLADEMASNRETYAGFLVSYALNSPVTSLTNHFFKPSQLKNRIKMIYKNRSSKWLRTSYVLVFGLISTVALLIAGCERIKKNFSEKQAGLPSQEMDSTKTIKVEGWVVNSANKLAIPGANVVVEGMERGTTTNNDGQFVINAPAYSTLIISYHGFTTQLRPLNGISGHGIALTPGDSSNNEITNADPGALSPIGKEKTETQELPVDTKVFTIVEKQPEFPGGNKAMYQFLARNIRYPSAAARSDVSGKVFISFIVSDKGEIKNVKLLKGIGFGCDEEALRVVSSFPNWKPGVQQGKNVTTQYTLPINFQLEDSGKQKQSAQQVSKPALDAAASKPVNKGAVVEGYSEKNADTVIYKQSSPVRVRILGNKSIPPWEQPLVYVDGELSKDPDVMSNLTPNSIQSISILKDKHATDTYGSKGKNGVILITTIQGRKIPN